MLSIVVAMDRRRAIGSRGRLPWHLPADLARFRKLTMGHTVIMGRRTFESIGRPLPGRRNIVVSRGGRYEADGCTVVRSLEEALREAAGDTEAFVIGGGEIFAQALPRAGRVYATVVDTEAPGADTFFPELGNEWRLVREEFREPDAENPHRMVFRVFERAGPA